MSLIADNLKAKKYKKDLFQQVLYTILPDNQHAADYILNDINFKFNMFLLID